MDKFWAVFSFRGRASRLCYWITLVGLYAVMALLGALLDAVDSLVADALVVLAMLPIMAAGLALVVRRLHDRNRSGWWAIGLYALPLLSIPCMALIDGKTGPGMALGGMLLLAVVGAEVWAIVELGFLRGTVGANPFGDDPLQPLAAAEVFS